ncbi:MAG: choice-of-anchor K domain-containing protein [Thiohalobacteraceae bacterium]
MNTKRIYAAITACAAALLGGQGTAHAAGIELAAFGSFQNIVAGPKTSQWLQNNDEVTDAVLLWGDVGCHQCDLTSRLIFDGLGSMHKPTFASLPVGTAFQVGYFSFLNGTPGHRRTNVSALDLSLSFHTTEGAIGDFVFGVTIDNTHDKQKKGNADHLTLVYDQGPYSFSYAGQLYSLDFLGLSTDGGKSFTDSLTVPENEKLASGLFATITAKSTPPIEPVPVPAAAWLLGSGLLGLIGLGRRR